MFIAWRIFLGNIKEIAIDSLHPKLDSNQNAGFWQKKPSLGETNEKANKQSANSWFEFRSQVANRRRQRDSRDRCLGGIPPWAP